MRIAFYGAGEPAQPFLQALSRRSDVGVIAVCDVDRRAAEQTAAGWGAQVFLSYEPMLEEAQPEALWVCVPPHLQGDVLLRAAQRRIPVFVTPPGAVDFFRARLYEEAIRKAKLVSAVGFLGRYSDVAREAREYLGANPIPLALGWWLAPPEEGGAGSAVNVLLWKDACRLIDGLRDFCGEVTRVRALTAGPRETAAGLVVQLEFVGGTVGMLTCASYARPTPRIELELLGEGWSLVLGKDLTTLRLDERDKTTILRCLNHPPTDQVDAFLKAVATGRAAPTLPSYSDALRTLAVCHAASVSVLEGRPVEIADLMA